MKKFFFTAALLLLLTAAVSCSPKNTDPAVGIYHASELKVSGTTFPASDYYPDGAFVRLDQDGKGLFSLGEGKSELSWVLDGHDITIECDGTTTTGTLYNEALVLKSILGTETDMTFIKPDTKLSELNKIEVQDGTVGEYQVRFVGADSFTPVQAEEGETGLNVYLEFTNLSSETKMCGGVIHIAMYQNGEELTSAISDLDKEEYTARTLLVRPGCSVRCAKTCLYKPENGEITVTANAWQKDPVHCVSAKYDPSALPGAPAEAFIYKEIPNPEWAAGHAPAGDLGSYHVSADKVETFDDNGKTLARVCFTIKNNSEENIIPYQTIAVRAFQDGVQLPIQAAGAEASIDSDNHYYNVIRPGEETACTLTYPTRSGNPFEIELVDENGTPIYGGVFPVN